MHRVDARHLAMGAGVTTLLFVLAVALDAALAPPTGTPRPTNLDFMVRGIPVVAVVGGAYIGTRGSRASSLWQGVASIVTDWLVLALLFLIADRIRGDYIFDPAAVFVTAAPWFILLGAVGAAVAALTDRKAKPAISRNRPFNLLLNR